MSPGPAPWRSVGGREGGRTESTAQKLDLTLGDRSPAAALGGRVRAQAGQRRPRDANRAGAGGRGCSRPGARTHQCPRVPLVGTPLERREGVGVPAVGVCARVSELHRGCLFRSALSHQREGGRGPVSGGSTNSPQSWAPRAPRAASPRVVWPPLPLVGGGRYRRLPHAPTSLAFGIFTVCFQARKFYLRKEGKGQGAIMPLIWNWTWLSERREGSCTA